MINCTAGELAARVLLVWGISQSPEINHAHLSFREPPISLGLVVHWSTARAMQLDRNKVRIIRLRLIPALQDQYSQFEQQVNVLGVLLFDVDFEFCAANTTALPHGAKFEKRFTMAAQEFAAFVPSSMRVLELDELTWKGTGTPEGANGTNTVEESLPSWPGPLTEEDGGHTYNYIIMMVLGAVLVLAFVGLTVGIVKLRHQRHAKPGLPYFNTPAPLSPTRSAARILPDDTLQGPGGGTLASVVSPLDPSSERGAAIAVAAGLETSECLNVANGDLVEVLAKGEGWLYGSAGGLWGYLPESCITWVDAGPAMPAVLTRPEASAVVVTATAAAAA